MKKEDFLVAGAITLGLAARYHLHYIMGIFLGVIQVTRAVTAQVAVVWISLCSRIQHKIVFLGELGSGITFTKGRKNRDIWKVQEIIGK
jgi:hypothetical protein